MRVLYFLVTAFLLSTVTNADVSIKSCEDWDKDGRFGIVSHRLATPPSRPIVIKGNVGRYASCLSKISRTRQCKGKNTLCTCEDWDKDGRFGIVKNSSKKISSKVLRGNIGNYYQCVSHKKKYRNTATKYHSCEDWDKDGRFGLVRYRLKDKAPKGKVLKSNHGNYYKCSTYKSKLRACKSPALCTCEDWNKDGRFGVVKYQGKKVNSKVLRSDVGPYARCLSKIR